MKKKIMFVIQNLGSGGAERVLCTLANYWCKNQIFDVCIARLDSEKPFYELQPEIVSESLDVHRICSSIKQKVTHKFEIINALTRIIRKHHPDVIISFMTLTNLLCIPAAKLTKTKLIISERIQHGFLKSFFWSIMRRIFYLLADGLVILSPLDYDYYTFVKKRRIIQNPAWLLNQAVLTEAKEEIILCVGRLDTQKGYDVFLKALSKIPNSLLDNWKVMIIGSGCLQNQLTALAEDLALTKKVEFLGTQKNVAEYYRKAAIFVTTSRSEGFPNALAEALSMGCACLATDCPTGPSELIQNEINGLLTKVDDAEAIAKNLIMLMNSKKLRIKLGEGARKSMQKYSTGNVAEKWKDFVNEVCL